MMFFASNVVNLIIRRMWNEDLRNKGQIHAGLNAVSMKVKKSKCVTARNETCAHAPCTIHGSCKCGLSAFCRGGGGED